MKGSLQQQISASGFTYFCVGSLPFIDPQAAVDFVMNTPGLLPFWPELPQRSFREFMLARTERVARADWTGYSQEESSALFALVERLRKEKRCLPLFKTQLMGPLSFMSYSQRMLGDFEKNLELAASLCVKQILWQGALLEHLAADLLFVLDEPALYDWPQLDADERVRVHEAYSYLYVAASDLGVRLGVHTCAGFYPEFLSFPFELLSFDLVAQNFEEVFCAEYEPLWQDTLARGVVVVPGVFDAVCEGEIEPCLEKGRVLYERAATYLKAISGEQVQSILISATCGHANASEAWLGRLYRRGLGEK